MFVSFPLNKRRKFERLPLYHFKIASLNFKHFRVGWTKLVPFATTLSLLALKCCHRITSVSFIYQRHAFEFSRRFAQTVLRPKSVLDFLATILCVLFETLSLTPIGHTGLTTGRSSIGHARATIQAKPFSSLRFAKTTFRFGKPSAGVLLMPLTPTFRRQIRQSTSALVVRIAKRSNIGSTGPR